MRIGCLEGNKSHGSLINIININEGDIRYININEGPLLGIETQQLLHAVKFLAVKELQIVVPQRK